MPEPTELNLTAVRKMLLADVADGMVADDEDGTPRLFCGDDGWAPVRRSIWEMYQAGWVRLPPGSGEPAERLTWELTDKGRAVLEAGAP